MLYNPSRDQARQFFIDSWAKFNRHETLTALEQKAAGIVSLHPEYHRYVQNADSFLQTDWKPESGEVNPFMHLGLHLAVQEQLDIDRPQGIRALYQTLSQKHDDEHAALHAILECLGETLWQAQRTGKALDSALYIQLVQNRTHSGAAS